MGYWYPPYTSPYSYLGGSRFSGKGFISIKVWRLAFKLLNLSHFTEISYENESYFNFIGYLKMVDGDGGGGVERTP